MGSLRPAFQPANTLNVGLSRLTDARGFESHHMVKVIRPVTKSCQQFDRASARRHQHLSKNETRPMLKQAPWMHLFLVAVLAAQLSTCSAFAVPIVTGIGALLFPVKNSEITSVSEAESRRYELELASDFFLQAFWTGKVGGGAKRLTQTQERQLKTSQVAEFRKRYGSTASSKSELLLLKEGGKKIIGCVGVQVDRVGDIGRVPLMSNLAVDPNYRRRGLAERLVQSAEDCVVSQFGASECYLYVEARNKGAVRLYQKLGYKQEYIDDTARTLLPTKDGKLESQPTVIVCMKKDLGRHRSPSWPW